MDTLEKGLALLFTAIIVGIVFANPKGTRGLLEGLGTFTTNTVGAFSGGRGFVQG